MRVDVDASRMQASDWLELHSVLAAASVIADMTTDTAMSTERDWSQSDVRMRDRSTSTLITATVTTTDACTEN